MTGLPRHDADALASAVAAEHAAVYAYGVVQAYSRGSAAEQQTAMGLASDSVAAHRASRDEAIERFARAKAKAPAAAPAYTLPGPVADEASAAQLAVKIEADTAQAWRSLVERATLPELREEGTRALADCAVRAARWRKICAVAPAVAPLPGENG